MPYYSRSLIWALFTKPDLGVGKAAGAKTYSCTSSPDNAASVKSRRAQRVRDFAVRSGVLLKTECPSGPWQKQKIEF
jgi:hypothetical protein